MGVNINPLPNFAFNKILPAVYDDALSYYELNAKVLAKTNEAVIQTNANTAEIASMAKYLQVPHYKGEWDPAKEYVPFDIVLYTDGNSYTCVVKSPAGTPPTDTRYWAKTGDYNAQIKHIEDEQIRYCKCYPTIADMQADENLVAGMVCLPSGFYKAGDGGEAFYIVSSVADNSIQSFALANGLYANIVPMAKYTPEVFGAHGNGADDDSEAFVKALSGNKNIVCMRGKTYYFNSIVNLKNEVYISLDGNQSNFKNMGIRLNITDDNVNQNAPYASSVKASIKNAIFTMDGNVNNKVFIYSGSPLSVEECYFTGYDYAVYAPTSPNVYIDYYFFKNINVTSLGTAFFKPPFLGDQMQFYSVHFHDTENNALVPYFQCSNPVYICDCMNFSFGNAHSLVTVENCHFEGANSGFVEEAASTTAPVTFNGCYFWANAKLCSSKYVSYNNCKFIANYQTMSGIKLGKTSISEINYDNCYVVLSSESNIIPHSGAYNIALIAPRFIDVIGKIPYYSYNISNRISTSVVKGDYDLGIPVTDFGAGNYTYRIMPSLFYDTVEGVARTPDNNSKQIVEVTQPKTIAVFTLDCASFPYTYFHIFRVAPNGAVHHAVIPPATGQFTLYDTGYSLNGFTYKNYTEGVPEESYNPKATLIKPNMLVTATSRKFTKSGYFSFNEVDNTLIYTP